MRSVSEQSRSGTSNHRSRARYWGTRICPHDMSLGQRRSALLVGKHQHLGTTVQRTSRRWRVCFVHISQTPEAPSIRVIRNGPRPFSIKEVPHLPAFPELCSCLPGGRNNFLIPWLLRLVVGDENVFLSVGNPRWGTQSMPGLKTPPWVHHVRPCCVLRTTSPEDVFVVNVGKRA